MNIHCMTASSMSGILVPDYVLTHASDMVKEFAPGTREYMVAYWLLERLDWRQWRTDEPA